MRQIMPFLLLPLLFACSEEAKKRPPNIVFIFTDDQTYQVFGYNNPEIKTPELDNLAAEGNIFQKNYTATPIHQFVASESVGVEGKTGQGHRMVRTKVWKYILTGTSEEVLYNEKEDPLELHNLM